jgi:hypothetical protein
MRSLDALAFLIAGLFGAYFFVAVCVALAVRR